MATESAAAGMARDSGSVTCRSTTKKGRAPQSGAAEDICSERCVLRVLGVDPAVAGATGYGVIECSGSVSTLLRFGALKLPAPATFASRLREVHRVIAELVAEFAPNAVAVESVFAALNMNTALRLAEIRGVVLLAAAQASVPAFSYSPREVKASVAGYGAASKEQMQQMVSSLLKLSSIPEPSDAADALAVALCHANLSRARARFAAATGLTPVTGGRRNAGRAVRV
jgi:crossover junction endodeoxyribonuclease RuvC